MNTLKSKKQLYTGLLVVSVIYASVFGIIFNLKMVGDSSSFLFQVVVALMSTGVLAIVTGFMFIFQSSIESRSQNKTKVFEKKIQFYEYALEIISAVAKESKISSETTNSLFKLTTRAMLVASPDAAEKLARFYNVIDLEESGRAQAFKEFVFAARTDLDLVDDLSEGRIKDFDKILNTIERSLEDEISQAIDNTPSENNSSSGKRSWSNEQKLKIIQDYYAQRDGSRYQWLKSTHNVTPAHIRTWKTQLNFKE